MSKEYTSFKGNICLVVSQFGIMLLQSLKINKSHFIKHCFIQLNISKRKENPLNSNKYKVSKITARIYSKSTGQTVDTNKIQCKNPTENTVAIWDNRSVIHYAIADFFPGRGLGYERIMDRIAIEGDQPQ